MSVWPASADDRSMQPCSPRLGQMGFHVTFLHIQDTLLQSHQTGADEPPDAQVKILPLHARHITDGMKPTVMPVNPPKKSHQQKSTAHLWLGLL